MTPMTQVGVCPLSKRPITFGQVCALGFMETVAIVAILDTHSKWHFHSWDLRKEMQPVFFDPTTVWHAPWVVGDKRWAGGACLNPICAR